MMLADVTPALQSEAETLRRDLTELNDLRGLQLGAGEKLTAGLKAAQSARTALSKAISDRTDLPKRFTEDQNTLLGLLESSDTLDAFASGLTISRMTPAASAILRLPKALCHCRCWAKSCAAPMNRMQQARSAPAFRWRHGRWRLSLPLGPRPSVFMAFCLTTEM